MTAIKICRVIDIHGARMCGELGVDFIGLHAINRLNKSKSNLYKTIASELHVYYSKTQPVLVTKVKEPVQLVNMVKATGISSIQFHYPVNSEFLTSISKSIKDAINLVPTLFSVVAADDPIGKDRIKEIKEFCDYILIDTSYLGGTGTKAPLAVIFDYLAETYPTKCFIAGGLNSNNVGNIIDSLHPYGVDIQSSLEFSSPPRYKNPKLVMKFVTKVKEASHTIIGRRHLMDDSSSRKLVSLALTTLPSNLIDSTLQKFQATDIDLFHLDFSDKSVAPMFDASPYEALSKTAVLTPCIPYDVHLFIRSLSKQESIIKKCILQNSLIRLAIIHMWDGCQMEPLLAHWAKLSEKLGVNMGVALQATMLATTNLNSLLHTLSQFPIKEISLITRSRTHSLDEIKRNDLNLLIQIAAFIHSYSTSIHLSVDRDMSYKKLKTLSSGHPTHVVVGANLLLSKQPQKMIRQFRQLLTSPKENTENA